MLLPPGKHARQTLDSGALPLSRTRGRNAMDIIHERCCGLDLHKRSVTACRLTPGPDGTVRQEVRTFATMTADLLALGDWLAEGGVTHVAMESTGVYWKPLRKLFDDR